MLQERSSGSVKIIWLDRSEVLARLHAIAHRNGEEHGEVRQVRLFGSLARGDQVGASDADVLIVLHSDTKGNFLERIQRFYSYGSPQIGGENHSTFVELGIYWHSGGGPWRCHCC